MEIGEVPQDKPKLVRHKVPKLIEKDGKTPVARELTREEAYGFFKPKMREEIGEIFSADSSKRVEELADLTQVLLDFETLYEMTPQRVKNARETKETQRLRKDNNRKLVEPLEQNFYDLTDQVFKSQSVVDMVDVLSDLHQLILDYAKKNNIDPRSIETLRKDKEKANGGFTKRIYLERIES